jgi:DNA repair exonuclease SbcCD ATPase subunit
MGEDRTRGHSRPDNTDTSTELRTRLELAERAQATLEDELRQAREVLAQERQRREQAEVERDELRRQLGGVEERRPEDADSEATTARELHQRLEEVRESPERADEGFVTRPGGPAGGAQEGSERPWWRRMFGG